MPQLFGGHQRGTSSLFNTTRGTPVNTPRVSSSMVRNQSPVNTPRMSSSALGNQTPVMSTHQAPVGLRTPETPVRTGFGAQMNQTSVSNCMMNKTGGGSSSPATSECGTYRFKRKSLQTPVQQNYGTPCVNKGPVSSENLTKTSEKCSLSTGASALNVVNTGVEGNKRVANILSKLRPNGTNQESNTGYVNCTDTMSETVSSHIQGNCSSKSNQNSLSSRLDSCTSVVQKMPESSSFNCVSLNNTSENIGTLNKGPTDSQYTSSLSSNVTFKSKWKFKSPPSKRGSEVSSPNVNPGITHNTVKSDGAVNGRAGGANNQWKLTAASCVNTEKGASAGKADIADLWEDGRLFQLHSFVFVDFNRLALRKSYIL